MTWRDWGLDQAREGVAALRFLTTIPLPGTAALFRTDRSGERLFIGSVYFPLVGFLLAALLSLVIVVIRNWLPPLVVAALIVVLHICLTGGLHLDGLMDCCDGLFGGRNRERKLEIMRDSRVGSFGVLGGASVLLISFAALASLPSDPLPWIFLLNIPVARWSMVLAMFLFPAARPDGLGAAVRATVTPKRLAVSTLLLLLLLACIAFFAGSWHLLIAAAVFMVAGIVLTVVAGYWVRRQLGGLTGDVYGALAEVIECICLLIAVIMFP